MENGITIPRRVGLGASGGPPRPGASPRGPGCHLPLGSGMVDSAWKWRTQQRFTGVGRRWSEDGCNPLVHLRLAWGNGRFEPLFGLALSPNS
jgi:hypothetical protein